MADKENLPLPSTNLEPNPKPKRSHHPLRQQREAKDEMEDAMDSHRSPPSSLEDVFQTDSPRRHASGRSPFKIFLKSSPKVSTHDNQSWKDKFSGAFPFTGLRKSSKKRSSQGHPSDVTSAGSNSPPLPEFLRNMISGISSASMNMDGDDKRAPSDPTSERLSRFFSHESSRSASPLVPDDAELAQDADVLSVYNPPFRPPMRERVSAIADRKITQAIPRDDLSVVISQEFGMTSHLSLHDPDFPMSE